MIDFKIDLIPGHAHSTPNFSRPFSSFNPAIAIAAFQGIYLHIFALAKQKVPGRFELPSQDSES